MKASYSQTLVLRSDVWLCDKIKAIYQKLGCSQVKLAWFLGLSITALRRYEIGATPATMLHEWAIDFLYEHVMAGKLVSLDSCQLRDMWNNALAGGNGHDSRVS